MINTMHLFLKWWCNIKLVIGKRWEHSSKETSKRYFEGHIELCDFANRIAIDKSKYSTLHSESLDSGGE